LRVPVAMHPWRVYDRHNPNMEPEHELRCPCDYCVFARTVI
jgi:hypothetical protein